MGVTGAGINQDSSALEEQRRRQEETKSPSSQAQEQKPAEEAKKARSSSPRQGLASQRAGQKITRAAEKATGSRDAANNRSESDWQAKGAKDGGKASVFPETLKANEASNVHNKKTRDFYEALNLMDKQLDNANNAFMRLGDNKIAFLSLTPNGRDRIGVIELKDKSAFEDLNLGVGDWKSIKTLENRDARNTIVKLRKQVKKQQEELKEFKGKNIEEQKKAYTKSRQIAGEVEQILSLASKLPQEERDVVSAMSNQVKMALAKAKDSNALQDASSRLKDLKNRQVLHGGKKQTIGKILLEDRINAARDSGYYKFLESKFKNVKDGLEEHEVSRTRVDYDGFIDGETSSGNKLTKEEHKAFAENHKKIKEQKQRADELLKTYRSLSAEDKKDYPAMARFESNLKEVEYEYTHYQEVIESGKDSVKNSAQKNDLAAQVDASGAGKYLQVQQKRTLALYKSLIEEQPVKDIQKRFSHLKQEDRERLIASVKEVNAMNKIFASMKSDDPSIISMPGYSVYANTAKHINGINESRLNILSDKDIYKKFNNNIDSLLSKHEDLADFATEIGTGIGEEKLLHDFRQSKPMYTPKDLKYKNSASLHDEHKRLSDEYDRIKHSDSYIDDNERKYYAEKLRNFYRNLSADDIKASIHKLYGKDGFDVERLMKEINAVEGKNSPTKKLLERRYKQIKEIKNNLDSMTNSELFANLNEFNKHGGEFSLLAPSYIDNGK